MTKKDQALVKKDVSASRTKFTSSWNKVWSGIFKKEIGLYTADFVDNNIIGLYTADFVDNFLGDLQRHIVFLHLENMKIS